MERKVIVIAGPTCSGKTGTGISLAQRLITEIISADSRQLYKHLSIGTAKPSVIELNLVKHHLVDFIEPDEEYNVSRFENEALKIIESLFQKKKTPIVVGGSGLYIKSLVEGIFNSVDADEELRNSLLEQREKFGNEFLYDELKKVDPISASKMLPQNWKRVMRALEVYKLTGEPIWKFQNDYKRKLDIKFYQYGLNWDRKKIYHRIEQRVDKMISDGLVDEVEKIISMGFNTSINALNTVGYKEIISYLKKEISIERAVDLIKRNSRRFAKRQMTWFNKNKELCWIDVNEDLSSEDIASIIFEKFVDS
jgi:tRNA dimethylallyltransferase